VIDAPDRTNPSDNRAADPAGEGAHPVSALFEMLPHILRTLRREPALAISLTYLLVAMAGIFYDFSFYRQFDIPVLTLSQIGDFLVAGVQQPMALVLVLSTFPLCWLFDKINLHGRRRRAAEGARLRASPDLSRWARGRLAFIDWMDGRRWYMQFVYVMVIVAYGWTFVGAYAGYRADAAKHGDAPEVRLWMNGTATPLAPSGEAPWTYLGAIAQYVFVYDRGNGRSAILPVNAIARIEPIASAKPSTGVMVAPIP
jgi:hypothetical protein